MNYFIAGGFTAIVFIALYIFALLMIEYTGSKDIKDLYYYINNKRRKNNVKT